MTTHARISCDASWCGGLDSLVIGGPRGEWAFTCAWGEKIGPCVASYGPTLAELEGIVNAVEWAATNVPAETITVLCDCDTAVKWARTHLGAVKSQPDNPMLGDLMRRIAAAVAASGKTFRFEWQTQSPGNDIERCDRLLRERLRYDRREGIRQKRARYKRNRRARRAAGRETT